MVAERYLCGAEVRCSLLRSYNNDVYLAVSGEQRLIVKLYGAGRRSEGELRYEVDLLEHLVAKGIAVARAVRAQDGTWVQHLPTSEGLRPILVFEVAPGAKPVPPRTPALYRAFGRAAAQMHAALADFASPHARLPLDTHLLIDRPLGILRPFLAGRAEDWAFVVDVAAQAKENILAFAAIGLDWGVCHGDLTLGNLHLTDDGQIVFFDFDDGGPGWRAQEFQGVYRFQQEANNGVWDAYRETYLTVRRLATADLAAIPSFALADHIWGMGVDASRRLPALIVEQRDALLTRQIARIKVLVADL
jgi:Ser/Thr protein kinase RdoA (MazF antagonist)